MLTLTALLAAAAFVAGLTGSWSPCGFSMISTIGPTGHSGGRRTTLAACAAFVPGALAGGVITFGLLAVVGDALGGGATAIAVGAALAGAAALAEAAGLRIVPQVRRQVPEHWRRVMPLPLAAALYGVLLGVGFTTFVLTFAVPALAGVALALGDPVAGLAIGLAFGAGRALPVVALAPLADHPAGIRATELMAERPGILRGFRLADALALAAVAVALGTESAQAQTPAGATVVAASGTDPSVAGPRVAWRDPAARTAVLDGRVLGGATHAAVGGPHTATIEGGRAVVRVRSTGAVVRSVAAGEADALAVSARWLVLRTRDDAEALTAVRLRDGRTSRPATYRSAAVGRPALDGDRLVFHLASSRQSRLVQSDLVTQARRTLRTARRSQLTQPSILGSWLLYVETTARSQRLQIGRRTPEGERRDRTLLSIGPAIQADEGVEPGGSAHGATSPYPRPAPETGPAQTLWTTALAADAAYVTRLTEREGGARAELLRVRR